MTGQEMIVKLSKNDSIYRGIAQLPKLRNTVVFQALKNAKLVEDRQDKKNDIDASKFERREVRLENGRRV